MVSRTTNVTPRVPPARPSGDSTAPSAEPAPAAPTPADQFDGPRRVALEFGLDYRFTDQVRALNGVEDARALGATLRARGFETREFTETEATAARMLDSLAIAAEALRADDTLVVHFAGHGTQVADVSGDEADGMDEGLVMADRVLLDDELAAALARFRPGVRVVVIADACSTGSITDAESTKPAADVLVLAAAHDWQVTPDGFLSKTLNMEFRDAASFKDLFARVRRHALSYAFTVHYPDSEPQLTVQGPGAAAFADEPLK